MVGDYAWEQGTQRFGVKENLDEFVKKHDYPLAVRFLRFAKGSRLLPKPLMLDARI